MGDYFSKQSAEYAGYRPLYPEELFRFLAKLCFGKELAWDCATGNGQAAFALSQHFKEVYATDISPEQLRLARQAGNICYRKEKAEECSLPDSSCDLITVATAIHWFDTEKFYAQANRILKPEGIIGIWSYAGCSVNEKVDPILFDFAYRQMRDYWPSGAWYNWNYHLDRLIFPFKPIVCPQFYARANYNLDELTSYIRSWSSVQQYVLRHGQNPIDMIRQYLSSTWGTNEEVKEITWKLHMKCGRKL